MRIKIKNPDIMTLDAESRILSGVDIFIDAGMIVALGEPPEDFVPDETIEATNHLAVPGFFNAHCHSPMTFERGWAEDLPLDRWFNERIWVAESALTDEDVYWGAALAACEMIRSGCVGFNDHYFYMGEVARVAAQSGMKASLTWCQFGIGDDKEIGANLEGAVKFARELQNSSEGRVKTVLGPHSPYVCPPEFLTEIGRIASESGLAVHIHASESPEQVANSLKSLGKTPIEHLASCGLFETRAIVAHALYLSENDISILAQKNVSVAHCPITYMKLAMGGTDLRPLLDAGINVALGTDGPGSNNDMDMKEVVRMVTLLQKFYNNDAEALAGDLPLRMATANGARAMGFSDSGSIEVGKSADIAFFNMDSPHWYPKHNLTANLVHCAKNGDIRHLLISGQPVMKNGKILTLDEERITHEADWRARAMVQKNMQIVREYKA
ncbi:MAG: N-ethylammeline chlorohydrolase [Candidatus Riflebacteria bacterium HGW-Riflebacteria-2]|nr:MAG: N-ethylammeline chlorohydrolase [Candidatus Riflebacteria bacterium HGW-Riflebacteria-2]